MNHVGDHVVAAAKHCDATGRPQNGDQKDWHTEPPLLLLSWLDNAVSNLAFRAPLSRLLVKMLMQPVGTDTHTSL
jgi:hypothetical protein